MTDVHVHGVDRELVRAEPERLKDLAEGECLSVSVAYELVGGSLHLRLDEPEQMLLVHRRRVVHVRVDLGKGITDDQSALMRRGI